MNEAALHAAREKGSMVAQPDFEYAVERVVAGKYLWTVYTIAHGLLLHVLRYGEEE